MKNKHILVFILVVVVILVGIFAWQGSQTSEDIVKIGAILPLTGSNALHGDLSVRGIELALSEFGKKYNIEILYEDSAFDPKQAVGAYNKLVNVDGVRAVLLLGSPVGMALSPLANEDEVPLFGIVAAPAYSTPDDFTFRIVGSAVVEAKSIVDTVVNKLGSQRVAIFAMNNDYGKGTATAFRATFEGSGSIVLEETFLPQDTDFRAQLTRIKEVDPDVVFVPALGRETGLVLKQARQLGLDAQFICAQACENPDLIEAAGEAAEGLLVVAPTDDANPAFASLYSDRYGERSNFISMRMYDAIRIASEAFVACGLTDAAPTCLLNSLNAVEDFPGTSYPITFDENGDINDQFVLKEVKNGVFVRRAN